MNEEIKEDTNCIIKAFDNTSITIIKEDTNSYLFRGTDVGKVLGLTNIRVTIQNFDEDERVVRKAYDSNNIERDTIFLTSRGIYRLLYSSKKPIAKQFRKWVGDILDDLIFNQGKELKIQLEKYHLELEEKNRLLENQQKQFIQDKQEILLTSYNKKCIVYIIKINENLYKFGNTDNIKRRFKEHYKEIGNNIELIYCIESKNNTLLENNLKEYLKTNTFRKEQIINNKNQTEIIEIDEPTLSIIKNTLEICNKNIYEDKEQLIIKRLELENENLKLQSENEQIKPEILQKKQKLEEHKEKIRLKKQEYYENNKKKIIDKVKEYRENNKENLIEKERLRKQLYYYDNKEKERLRKQEYYKNNREKILEKQRIYSNKKKTTLI